MLNLIKVNDRLIINPHHVAFAQWEGEALVLHFAVPKPVRESRVGQFPARLGPITRCAFSKVTTPGGPGRASCGASVRRWGDVKCRFPSRPPIPT